MADPIQDDENFTPTYEDSDARIPKPDPNEAPVEDLTEPVEDAVPAKSPTEVPAEKPTETHPLDLIAQAVRAGISEEEIAEMSGPELKRYIRQTERLNQRFEQAVAKAAPEAKAEPDAEDELIKQLDDETLFDPTHAKLFKTILADNKQLKAKIASIEPTVQTTSQQAQEAALDASLDKIMPGFSKDFDLSTEEGRSKRNELWSMMAAIQSRERSAGKFTNMETHARQAAKALDFVPTSKQAEKAKKAEDFKKSAEEYDEGALAPAVNRRPHETTVDRVQKILDAKNRARVAESSVKWND